MTCVRVRFVIDPSLFIVLWSHYKTGEMKEWLMRSFSTGSSQGEGNCLTLANKESRRQRDGSDEDTNELRSNVTSGFILQKFTLYPLNKNRKE